MKRKILFGVVLVAFTVAYCEGAIRKATDETATIVRKCHSLAKPISLVLDGLSNTTVVTNHGVAYLNFTNDVERREYHYPLSNLAHPKMVKVRDAVGNGYDVCFNECGRPTKYMEYKNEQLHGVGLEFYTNGVVRVRMAFTNDCFIGHQQFYSETGDLISEGNLSGSIFRIQINKLQ